MRTKPIVAIAITLLLLGCSKPEDKVLGEWKVDPNSVSTGNPKTDALVKEQVSKMKDVLELKSDKTFTNGTQSGTYTFTDNKVTLTGGVGGKSVTQELTLSPDGKKLELTVGVIRISLVRAN